MMEHASDFCGTFRRLTEGKARTKASPADQLPHAPGACEGRWRAALSETTPAGRNFGSLNRFELTDLKVDAPENSRFGSQLQFDRSVWEMSRAEDNSAVAHGTHSSAEDATFVFDRQNEIPAVFRGWLIKWQGVVDANNASRQQIGESIDVAGSYLQIAKGRIHPVGQRIERSNGSSVQPLAQRS
jgi:hypothetical protein